MTAEPVVPGIRRPRPQRVAQGDGTEPWHGTANGARFHRCGCVPCRSAGAAAVAAYRERLRAAPIPDEVHGTKNGYDSYSCRCAPCRSARYADDILHRPPIKPKKEHREPKKEYREMKTTRPPRPSVYTTIEPAGMTLARAMEIAIAAGQRATLTAPPVVSRPELNEKIRELNATGISDAEIARQLELKITVIGARRRGMGLPAVCGPFGRPLVTA